MHKSRERERERKRADIGKISNQNTTTLKVSATDGLTQRATAQHSPLDFQLRHIVESRTSSATLQANLKQLRNRKHMIIQEPRDEQCKLYIKNAFRACYVPKEVSLQKPSQLTTGISST
ncbi:hypothetical protein EVAR_74243_1 [Eumeta japonica]|uniref:Uncharacterized protein n=1 Tax=Eumeta variegata TaxID=151549 RepID=A0A4C1SCQ9_EUMVA|nr:hypothetical protein EVAR_74243_1 [Eumeta japonica]